MVLAPWSQVVSTNCSKKVLNNSLLDEPVTFSSLLLGKSSIIRISIRYTIWSSLYWRICWSWRRSVPRWRDECMAEQCSVCLTQVQELVFALIYEWAQLKILKIFSFLCLQQISRCIMNKILLLGLNRKICSRAFKSLIFLFV